MRASLPLQFRHQRGVGVLVPRFGVRVESRDVQLAQGGQVGRADQRLDAGPRWCRPATGGATAAGSGTPPGRRPSRSPRRCHPAPDTRCAPGGVTIAVPGRRWRGSSRVRGGCPAPAAESRPAPGHSPSRWHQDRSTSRSRCRWGECASATKPSGVIQLRRRWKRSSSPRKGEAARACTAASFICVSPSSRARSRRRWARRTARRRLRPAGGCSAGPGRSGAPNAGHGPGCCARGRAELVAAQRQRLHRTRGCRVGQGGQPRILDGTAVKAQGWEVERK